MAPNTSTPSNANNYYDKGSVELAVETPVVRKRLETRNALTNLAGKNGAERLLIVLVGLPARGKSFIARKLLNYMVWRGNHCRIFNVGKYRRKVATEDQKADFFDDSNHNAARLRQEAAELALKDTLDWLEDMDDSSITEDSTSNLSLGSDESSAGSFEPTDPYYSNRLSYSERRKFHRIAIFDATNSTRERRQWILKECAKADTARVSCGGRRTGVLFLESICNDQELLQENFQAKISSCPDFDGMTNQEALDDLQSRIAKYEARYETIENDESPQQISYIKVFNLSSTILANHVYGRLAKVVLPAIMAWNTGSRPIFLCRAGETKAMENYMKTLQEQHEQQQQQQKHPKLDSMVRNRIHRKRSDSLGGRGHRFRDALCDFIEQEGMEFMQRKHQNVMHPSKMDTGTSLGGLHDKEEHPFEYESCYQDYNNDNHDNHDDGSEHKDAELAAEASLQHPHHLPFPCLVFSSTLPRAVETATWKHPFPVKDVTNLNPLDMGDFAGMDLASIKEQHPAWYKRLQREPFHTRFPGGESYGDLIDRLYSIIIDMEQQLGLAVAVSHVSVLQVLVSYFRSTPIHKCMDIEIPMHTVLKFVPLRGGGWLESQHVLLPDQDAFEPEALLDEDKDGDEPIWGDSRSCLPHRINSE